MQSLYIDGRWHKKGKDQDLPYSSGIARCETWRGAGHSAMIGKKPCYQSYQFYSYSTISLLAVIHWHESTGHHHEIIVITVIVDMNSHGMVEWMLNIQPLFCHTIHTCEGCGVKDGSRGALALETLPTFLRWTTPWDPLLELRFLAMSWRCSSHCWESSLVQV